MQLDGLQRMQRMQRMRRMQRMQRMQHMLADPAIRHHFLILACLEVCLAHGHLTTLPT